MRAASSLCVGAREQHRRFALVHESSIVTVHWCMRAASPLAGANALDPQPRAVAFMCLINSDMSSRSLLTRPPAKNRGRAAARCPLPVVESKPQGATKNNSVNPWWEAGQRPGA
jgi:hypothetical protein